MRYNLGFMQGRLIKPIKKKIQYFPDQSWFEELVIAQNFFKFVEWTVNFENIKKNPLLKKKLEKKFIKKIKLVKIKINSVTCDFFMQYPIFKKKYFYKYKEIENYLSILINNCEKLEIKYIVLPLVDNSSIKNLLEENLLINFVSKFEKKLKNTNIIFEIDYPPKDVLRFIKRFNIKKFGINYDTGNSSGLGYQIKEEMKYFRYVKNIHIKDKKFRGKTVRLGKGNCNFKSFFYFLKKIKYKGNLILQTARNIKNMDIYEICVNKSFLERFCEK